MRLRTRAEAPTLPGLTGVARVGRDAGTLQTRLRPAEIAVVDHVDMDRATAQSLVDAGIAAVLNVQPMISGRYPNQGPAVLVEAGVVVVDQLDADLAAAVRDGSTVRVHEGVVHVKEREFAGRVFDAALLERLLEKSREGLTSQLDTFTHNASAFLRREQDLLLHGQGFPAVETRIEGRPVVVVVRGADHLDELRSIRRFLREQRPVLVGVDRAADDLLEAGFEPDVIVISSGSDASLPSAKVLKVASDVVAVVPEGISKEAAGQLDRLGVRPAKIRTQAAAEDVALLLADRGEAAVIVGVGMHADLDDFLDRRRAGLASTYLTRLKVGSRLVDASAVPTLYAGRVRPIHLFVVLLAGLAALLVAVAVTPAGSEWFAPLGEAVQRFYDYLRGLLR